MSLCLNVSVNPSCLGAWQEICQIPGFASQYLSNLSKSGSMANSIKTDGGNFLQYKNKISFILDIFEENYFYPCIFKGSDRLCMVFELSLIAKSTLKIIFLGGYVLRIVFFKLLNNDDKKFNKNSTVNN